MVAFLTWLFWTAVVAGLSYTISALTTKLPDRPAITPADLSEPDIREGATYPIIFGTNWIEAPIIAWYGDIEITPLIDHKTINTGFNNKRQYYQVGTTYDVGLHCILCQGVTDGIKQFKANDVTIWPTAQDVTAYSADGANSAIIDEPNAFGGRYSGGGITGTISFEYGEGAQAQNSYLVTQLGADVSAYRGVTAAVFEKVNVGNSPYLPKMAFLVKRTDVLTDGSAQWYSAKAVINTYDLNPAHILRECYTNTEWGFGISSGLLDDTTWEAVADDLYDESFGLSMKWEDPNQSLYDFVQDVLRHIDAKIYQDPETGYIVLKLLRDDYVVASLDSYDESDVVSVTDFSRGVVWEGVNSLDMEFWDRAYNAPIVIPNNDIASANMQNNKRVPQKRTYYGCMNKTLAGKIIARDRMQIGSFPAMMTLKSKRTMNTLRPGDVFKFSYEPLDITDIVLRVHEVEFGTLKEGTLKIKCTEDIFSIQTALFAEVPDSAWSTPELTASESPSVKVMEMPYYLASQLLTSETYFDTIKDTTDGIALVMAAFATNSFDFELELREDTGDSFVNYGTNQYTHTAVLEEDLTANAVEVTFVISDFTLVQREVKSQYVYLALIGETVYYPGLPIVIGNEILLVTAIDYGTNEVTAYRGAFDTVPEAHSDGDYIYFPTFFTTFMDELLIADGDTPGVKVYPNTPQETLDTTTIINSDEFDSRLVRPYPPDDILINAVSFASSFSGQPTLTWYDRDRTEINTLQYTGLHTASAEAGTTYKLEIYDENNLLVRTENPVTSPYEYTWENEMADCSLGSGDPLNTQLRFVLTSIRGGYDSFQSIDITVQRV